MVKVNIKLTFDFHARPATFFVNKATQYQSDIDLKLHDQIANGKSILNVMTLEVVKGDVVELIINGVDELQAQEALQVFFLDYRDA